MSQFIIFVYNLACSCLSVCSEVKYKVAHVRKVFQYFTSRKKMLPLYDRPKYNQFFISDFNFKFHYKYFLKAIFTILKDTFVMLSPCESLEAILVAINCCVC